jgi:hypothetical protein
MQAAAHPAQSDRQPPISRRRSIASALDLRTAHPVSAD